MISGLDVSSQREAFCFVLGIIFNQRIRAEQAWQAPMELLRRLSLPDLAGEHNLRIPSVIVGMGNSPVYEAITAVPALHPFGSTMAKNVMVAAQIVSQHYADDARKLWTPVVPAGELIQRFEAFRGVGTHKAEVALFLLTIEQGVEVLDDGIFRDPTLRCPRLGNAFSDCLEVVT